jgi:hypothetical protein
MCTGRDYRAAEHVARSKHARVVIDSGYKTLLSPVSKHVLTGVMAHGACIACPRSSGETREQSVFDYRVQPQQSLSTLQLVAESFRCEEYSRMSFPIDRFNVAISESVTLTLAVSGQALSNHRIIN